jgi:paraquat-inducible protein B
MSSRVSPSTVGAFVLVGVALAVVVTLILGSGAFFQDRYDLLSFFEGDVTGLDAGSPVRYRGVPIGQVSEVWISLPNDPRDLTDTRIPVIYTLNLTHLRGLTRGGQADLTDPGALESLIERGLRAQLQGANIVTGQRAIELDVFPDAEDRRLDPAGFGPDGPPAPELPAVPNTMAQLQDRALAAVNEVAAIDFQGLAARVDSTLTGIGAILSSGGIESTLASVDGTMAEFSTAASSFSELVGDLQSTNAEVTSGIQATVESSLRTLATMDTTLHSIRGALNPDAPVLYRLDLTLEEMREAARAVRLLADYLEQNPSALLRGRGGSEEEQ